jgi:hypothetical protein
VKKQWSVLLLACLALGCDDPADMAPRLHLTEEAVVLAAEKFEDPDPASLSPDSSDYINNLFGNVNPSNTGLNLGLPSYAYFQGLIYSRKNVFMAGQVRVVGGVIATGNLTLAGDGMLTTNPESQLERVSVSKARWKVESWTQE